MPEQLERERPEPSVIENQDTAPVERIDELLGTPARDWKQVGTTILAALMPLIIIAMAVVAIKPGHEVEKWILVGVVAVALAFDYVNGMNDAGNAIATVIATRVLPPVIALLMAAVLNFVGAILHTGVAKFISGEIFFPEQVTIMMILAGLLGAVAWSSLMTMAGMPISLSHSLIGGLLGAVLVGGAGIKGAGVVKVVIWMIAAPLLGLAVGFLLMVLLMWLFHRLSPQKINKHFRVWQIVSSGFVALSHGGNDAQKAMGVITLALFTAKVQSDLEVAVWVKIACALVIALGTAIGGWRVIRTLGHKMIKLMPVHGFAAETAAAATIQLATLMHAPVSTTHVITASIMGVGASKRLSAVRWGVASNIMVAWVFTIPACALAGALLYALVRALGLS